MCRVRGTFTRVGSRVRVCRVRVGIQGQVCRSRVCRVWAMYTRVCV